MYDISRKIVEDIAKTEEIDLYVLDYYTEDAEREYPLYSHIDRHTKEFLVFIFTCMEEIDTLCSPEYIHSFGHLYPKYMHEMETKKETLRGALWYLRGEPVYTSLKQDYTDEQEQYYIERLESTFHLVASIVSRDMPRDIIQKLGNIDENYPLALDPVAIRVNNYTDLQRHFRENCYIQDPKMFRESDSMLWDTLTYRNMSTYPPYPSVNITMYVVDHHLQIYLDENVSIVSIPLTLALGRRIAMSILNNYRGDKQLAEVFANKTRKR